MPNDLPPPPGWGDDPLFAYLSDAARNRYATFVRLPSLCGHLSALDAVFSRLDQWKDPPNKLSMMLAFRCHAAFRAACEHAMAGQVADIFPSVRATLEFAAYAVYLFHDTELAEAWLRRHDSPETLRRLRKDFHHRTVLESISAADADIGALFGELYQHAIDNGGHPNERSISLNAKWIPAGGGAVVQQLYLHNEAPYIAFGLRSVIEAGASAVAMLRLVLAERMGPDTPDDRRLRMEFRTARMEHEASMGSAIEG